MQEITLQEIEEKAIGFADDNKSWHFHILTPACLFNKSGKFAFILESSTDKEVFVNYSDVSVMNLGKTLLPYLHGQEIFKTSKKENGTHPLLNGILVRAKELNDNGKSWHHHMLFPDCIYNTHQGKWTIVFEDPETQEKKELVYINEPKDDLSQIEELYYKQKTLS